MLLTICAAWNNASRHNFVHRPDRLRDVSLSLIKKRKVRSFVSLACAIVILLFLNIASVNASAIYLSAPKPRALFMIYMFKPTILQSIDVSDCVM